MSRYNKHREGTKEGYDDEAAEIKKINIIDIDEKMEKEDYKEKNEE